MSYLKAKKRLDTTLHYVQYILARIVLAGGIGFLIYSILIQKPGAIIFYSIFVLYTLILVVKVFDKPIEIEFDENYIYLDKGKERIALNKITKIKRNLILYESDGTESKFKLPNFHFLDKKWKELKGFINTKKH